MNPFFIGMIVFFLIAVILGISGKTMENNNSTKSNGKKVSYASYAASGVTGILFLSGLAAMYYKPKP